MSVLGKVWRVGILSLALLSVLLILGNMWVVSSTQASIFSDYSLVPSNPVGLVLGTSSRLANGMPNAFFDHRMQTAADLYHLRKISHIIVSGDNRTKFYNEPMEMKRALVKLGVPDSVITLDYAGLRTLDSVIRSKEIFGQNHITIITQPFHSYRALFISHYFDIDAVALVAPSPDPDQQPSVKVYLREYLARAKAILDLYILKTSPRHLGDKEPIAI
ncbi:MAG TPA: ElyC/SanA/YdcF family protein [Cyclobacteriaceae bacterium]|nr:ElyC/SanA/YdcF family protein [Cyclobacteriaceae bacterium]